MASLYRTLRGTDVPSTSRIMYEDTLGQASIGRGFPTTPRASGISAVNVTPPASTGRVAPLTPTSSTAATNYFSPYTILGGTADEHQVATPTYGGPTINPDGSVSAGMPNSWGDFGFNPFSNWSGTNVDTGQNWNIGNKFLSDQGAQKLFEFLGLGNAPVYNTPGSIQNYSSNPGAIYGPNSGNTSGPGGVGMWRYVDPTTGVLTDLSPFADYFLTGRGDLGKYIFQNMNDPGLQALQSFSPLERFQSVSDLQNAIQGITPQGYAFAKAQGSVNSSPAPGTGSQGNSNTGNGTSGQTGNRSAIDDFISLIQGIYNGSNPFTIQSGTLGTPGAPFGQDYLDGLKTITNLTGLGGNLASLLTASDLYNLSPQGLYAKFGPAAYLERQLFPEFYM